MDKSSASGQSEAGHSLREMRWVAIFWATMTVYSVTVCSLYGYGRTPETLTYYLGFPDWVFWGVIAPWAFSTVFSIWFAMFVMQDDDIRESGLDRQVAE